MIVSGGVMWTPPYKQPFLDRGVALLIDGLGSDEEQSNFVAAVLHLIDACGLKAVAEGIETAEQAAELVRLGCGSGQGYYFSRPVPAAQIEALLVQGAAGD